MEITNSVDQSMANEESNQTPLQFSGSGKEFFKIWIVNIVLTILTLGIYSAWAKVRTNQYFYANTSLKGNAFQYLATGMTIFKGRMVAVGLLIAYSLFQVLFPSIGWVAAILLMVAIPALIVLSLSFRLRNTSFRGLTFHFQRDFKKAYVLFAAPLILFAAFLIPMSMHTATPEYQQAQEYNEMMKEFAEDDYYTDEEIAILDEYAASYQLNLDENGKAIQPQPPAWIFLPYFILFLLFPLWDKLFTAFKINGAQFGQSPFKFDATTWDFFKMYLLFIGITVGLVVVGAVVVTLVQQNIFVLGNIKLLASLGAIAVMAFYLFLFSFFNVYRYNLMANKTSVDEVKLVSNLEVAGLSWIYFSNTLLIIFTLGLATPWAKVRSVRYRVERTGVIALSLDHFLVKNETDRRALGEEIGEAFDVDIGF